MSSGGLGALKVVNARQWGIHTQARNLSQQSDEEDPYTKTLIYLSSVLVYHYVYFKCPENFILTIVSCGSVCLNTGQQLRGVDNCCVGMAYKQKIFQPDPNHS